MKQKIDSDIIKEQLTAITENRLFNKSSRLINLITFLVEESLKGNYLKEDIIGMEVFDSDYTSSKNDGLVRVYMHKLRKKLDAYYAEDGKDAPIVFQLEKGSYQVNFIISGLTEEKKVKTIEKIKKAGLLWDKKTLAITLVFGVSVAIAGYFYLSREKLYLWDAFFNNNSSNLCILADQVVMTKKDGLMGEIFTNVEVNSTEDFVKYIDDNNIDNLQKEGYTLYTKAIPHSVYKLAFWFFKHHSEFVSVAESEFRYQESKRNNLLYIGQQKTMNVSKELFLRDSKIFNTEEYHFVSYKNGKKTSYRPSYDKDIRSEYAMVSYMQLDEGNKAIYFVSNNDIGTMAVVNKFTNPTFLNEFYKSLPSTEVFFNALFKVDGVGRTDISCELVDLEVVK